MAATNKVRYVGNINGAPGPWKFPLKVGAGASTPIKRGEVCKVASLIAAPEASDEAMSSVIVVSDCEIRSGDLAGWHDFIIPRPGDLFEADLATAAAPNPGAALYISDSQTLTTSGTNQIAQAVDETMLPKQGFQSVNPSPDQGTTVRTRDTVRFMFKAGVSFYGVLQA